MSRFGTFKINEVEYDLDDLTLDEVEQIEEHAGAPFGEINYGSAKGMKAFAFAMLRRSDPEITWEEVGKTKLVAFVPADEELPPLPPASNGSEVVEADGSVLEDSGAPDSLASTTG